MEIKVNGEPVTLPDGQTGLLDMLAQIGISPEQTGIAVAVNLELVPRGEWKALFLKAGDAIEVITARQGG
jgi:sulfur carrier protein